EVTFDIDANGILNVSARDMGTGKENKIRIENSSGMSKDEIERMTRDAESHADEDRRKKELLDARNEADSITWQIEKMLKDAGDKLNEQDRAPIQSGIEKVRSAARGDDPSAIKRSIEDLKQAAEAMARHMGGGGGGGGGQPGGDGGASPNGANGTAKGG